jgi:hypothetical protein
MTGPLRGPVRALRAGLLGATSLSLALGAHLAAGGQRPPLTLLLVCAGVLALTAAAATAGRVRLLLLLLLLGAQQVLLHLVLDAGGSAVGCGAVDSHLGHLAEAGRSCAPSAAGTTSAWAMVAAHVLATGATAWLLSRGEQALWALADQVIRVATAGPAPWPRSTAVLLVPPVPTVVAVPGPSPAAPRGPPVAGLS